MDLFRRTARGELAEVLGAGPNNSALDQDKLHRTYGFAQAAEAEARRRLAPYARELEAYARGVNAYAASLDPKSMPPEFQILQYSFRPWTPADTCVVVKIFPEALSDTWRLDVMRQALSVLPADKRAELLPEISPIDVLVVGKDTQSKGKSAHVKREPVSREALAKLAYNQEIAAAALDRIGFDTDALAASNNWVVSGSHTVTGKPLLANDPHLRPTAPSIWHMVHLSAPGVRVAGVAPLVCRASLSVITIALPGDSRMLDRMFRICMSRNLIPTIRSSTKRRPAGRTRSFVTKRSKSEKAFGSSEYDTVTHDVTVTRHGPIIFEGDGKRYALRWTALDPAKNNPDSTHTSESRAQLERVQYRARVVYRADAEHRLR